MKHIIGFVAVFVILYSCSNKNSTPRGILKPAKMQAVLWDVLRIDNYTNDYIKKDSTKHPSSEAAKMQEQVFELNKITKEDFYKSFDYYKNHPALMQTMLDSLINKYTRDRIISTQPKAIKDTTLQ